MNLITHWFRKHFSNPQVVLLALLLIVMVAAIILVAGMLAPVIAAIIIAYLLQGLVSRLHRVGLSDTIAAALVFLTFLIFTFFLVLGLLPVLLDQVTQLFLQLPTMLMEVQRILLALPDTYALISEDQVRQFMASLRSDIFDLSRQLLALSVVSAVTLITIIVYIVLVPFLVFFLIKDRKIIVSWFTGFLPKDRQLTNQVWGEVNRQIGNYVRGKVAEILIVGSVSYVAFVLLGVEYSLLLAAMTGLSVLIPYVGVVVVFVPVATVSYFQWGNTPEWLYVLAAYVIIQLIDGNILAPLLLSDAVNLHPVAIIVAILFFGGLWGFWGVFFAIPLATVVQAVLRAWPRPQRVTGDDPPALSGQP